MRFAFYSNLDGVPWGGSEDLWSATASRLLTQHHAASACVHDWGSAEAPTLRDLATQGLRLHRRRTPKNLTTAGLVLQRLSHRLHLRRPERSAIEALADESPDLTLVNIAGGFPDRWNCGVLAGRKLPYAILIQAASESWWPSDQVREKAIELIRAARAVFFVSGGNRQMYRKQLLFEHPNTYTVRNPFRVSAVDPLPWPEPSSPLRIAFVGRLEPEAKGCDLMLEALARPNWRDRDFHLTVFGTGRSEQGVKALAASLPLGSRVAFAGHVSDITAIWRDYHVLLLPSRYEGMPLAIVEAMWCGRPCIVTDVAGHREFVADGVTGFVAPHPSVDAVEAALERMWGARARLPAIGLEAARTVRRLVPPDPVAAFTQILVDLARPMRH